MPLEQDLGWIKAVHEGTEPPLNKKMLWFDSTVKLMKRYNFDTLIWLPLNISLEDPPYYDPSSGSPLSNVVTINYDLDMSYPDSFKFKTYEEAADWVRNNYTLDYENMWQVILPSGFISESIVAHDFMPITGQQGTYIDSASSDAVESIAPRKHFSNVYINELSLGDGVVCRMKDVGILSIVPDAVVSDFPELYLENCVVSEADFEQIVVSAYNSEIVDVASGWGGHAHQLISCHIHDLDDFTGSVIDCLYELYETSESVDVSGSVFIDDLRLSMPNGVLEISVDAAGAIVTENLRGSISIVLGSGATWINRGGKYDNRVSGLASTDSQAAIDELAHGLVMERELLEGFFLPSVDELMAIYTNLHATGLVVYPTGWYWSSTEDSFDPATTATAVQFASGAAQLTSKAAVQKYFKCLAYVGESEIYQIGSEGRAGGHIFHIDDSDPSAVIYYEAIAGGSPVAWSNIVSVAIGTTETGIGEGVKNTDAIVAQGGHTASAASLCKDTLMESNPKGVRPIDAFRKLHERHIQRFNRTFLALVSQSGAPAVKPTMIILENTLGVIPEWTYGGVGSYLLDTVEEFGMSKMAIQVGQCANATPFIDLTGYVGARIIELVTKDASGTHVDGVLYYTSFRIDIYP